VTSVGVEPGRMVKLLRGKFVIDPVENSDEKLRSASSVLTRFGPYEIDRTNGEVRKFGVKLKLAGQPLEVLLLLVERAGEIVTREELKQRLWPEDVFVDFERSLNSAVKKLRAALDDNPENPRYIETQPRKGYRFIGQIEAIYPAPNSRNEIPGPVQIVPLAAEALGDTTPDARAARSHSFRWMWAGLALLVTTAGLVLAFQQRITNSARMRPASKGPNIRSSIAILGFKNLSSRHEADWLGPAIAQMLATELRTGGNLRIIPDEAVTRAKSDLNLKEKDGYPRDTLRELDNILASDYIVAGSYVALGDKESGQVRLDLRLEETISGETLASIAVSSKQSEIFDLVGRAGREMRLKVGGSIGGAGDTDWRTTLPSNADAARLYSEGLNRLRKANNVSAIELIQQSVTIEPGFALGHSALAEAWQALGYDARSQASAQKALALAAPLPENVRLKVEGQYYESLHDWAGAIPAYRHLFLDYPDDLEAGLKLAASEISAGKLSEAASTISSLRSLQADPDPRIDLVQALVASRTGDYRGQQALAESAAKKAKVSGSQLLFARAKMVEGWALDDQAQLDNSLQAYRVAQPIFEAAGDTENAATVLDDIGIVLQKKGDLKAARDNLEEAQKRFRQVGDQNGLGSSLTNLGELYHTQGDLIGATELYREALEIFRKTSRKENEYATLNNLGGVLFESGDFREARKNFETVLEVRQTTGDKSLVSYAKSNLAAVLWVQGELERSSTLLQEALRTFREIGDRSGIASVDTGYSKMLISKNDLHGARAALLEALNIDQETGAKGEAAFVRILLAQVALLEGHPEQVDEATLESSINEIHAEEHGGDEVEALAIKIQFSLARKQLGPAQQDLERAQLVRNTSWLSKHHLALAAARIDAAQGKIVSSRRKIERAKSQAEKVGCHSCDLGSLYPALAN
jgi:DNA-binding winged helix-turn-helix (wHTH) protein/Tfp pilus assembly protein PilF/TolB-like protein